jgi:Cu/Ag efflux protein CusF
MRAEAVIAALLALGVPGAAIADRETPRFAQAAAAHKGEGTVHKVDAAAGRLNISHGPIPSLNWPAMTMDFQVRDKAVLRDVKPGQKVEITIVQEGASKFVVTQVKPLQ